MGILSILKTILGLNGSRHRREPERGIQVEQESRREPAPETASERAVKESQPAAVETDASSAASDLATGDEHVTAASAEGERPEEPSGEPASTGEADLQSIKGIGPAYEERLGEAGITTTADLARANATDVAEETELSEKRIEEWIERAAAR